MPLARNFFNEKEQKLIVDAITEAELKTSGEIRIHIDNFCLGNELKKAEKIFHRLKMDQTENRNGILIYIATVNKKISVYGDAGIHQRLGEKFWNPLVENLINEFRQNRKAESLVKCILDCGEQLARYFPYEAGDKNELSNSISY